MPRVSVTELPDTETPEGVWFVPATRTVKSVVAGVEFVSRASL